MNKSRRLLSGVGLAATKAAHRVKAKGRLGGGGSYGAGGVSAVVGFVGWWGGDGRALWMGEERSGDQREVRTSSGRSTK